MEEAEVLVLIVTEKEVCILCTVDEDFKILFDGTRFKLLWKFKLSFLIDLFF